jgi:hypothetical protein
MSIYARFAAFQPIGHDGAALFKPGTVEAARVPVRGLVGAWTWRRTDRLAVVQKRIRARTEHVYREMCDGTISHAAYDRQAKALDDRFRRVSFALRRLRREERSLESRIAAGAFAFAGDTDRVPACVSSLGN